MREILFRGKQVDNGGWVEGLLSQTTVIAADKPAYVATTIDELFEKPFDGAWHEVDPSTVGQYIGLKDKNGKRIFEGDIVCFSRHNALGHLNKRIGEVKYYDELPYILATTGNAWDWCDRFNIEVIGNIHDNPELIGG